MSFINANRKRSSAILAVILTTAFAAAALGQDPCTAPGPGLTQLPDQMPLPGTDQFGMLSDQDVFFPLQSTEEGR